MCGRYSNHVKAMLDWSALLGEWPEEVGESHNLAPGQAVAGFTADAGLAMRWGLIPPWLDEASNKYSTFNARVESVVDKPAYRHAWKQSLRCVIPALGYYEWRKLDAGKQPYFIRAEEPEPLFLAGLYEPARSEQIRASCTMITRPASDDLKFIHPRMPAMIPRLELARWFQAGADEALAMVSGEPDIGLLHYQVSKQVNNARNQGDDLIQPLED